MSDFDPEAPIGSFMRRANKEGVVRVTAEEWKAMALSIADICDKTPSYGTPDLRMFGKPVEWVDVANVAG